MTKPRFSIFRQGDVLLHMWSKERIDKNTEYKFMVFCYGLPSHPYQHNPAKVERFLEAGYVLVYPDYIGTWASYGKMTWEGCVATIIKTIEFLKKGNGIELEGNSEIKWGTGEIILVGGSFGGSIALVAGAKSGDVKKIIAVAAPTNWKNHSKIKEESGEPIEDLYYIIERGWKNLWRIPSKKEWDRLVKGEADINPADYIEKLKNKNVFLLHGEKDKIVSHIRSSELYRNLKKGKGKHKLFILKEEGHLGNDALGRADVAERVLKWL